MPSARAANAENMALVVGKKSWRKWLLDGRAESCGAVISRRFAEAGAENDESKMMAASGTIAGVGVSHVLPT